MTLIACDIRCFHPHPLDVALREIRAAGLDRVELPLGALGAAEDGNPGADDDTASRARRILGDLGLQAAAVHIGGLDQTTEADFARRLDKAQELGSSLVIADAGPHASGLQPETIDAPLRRLLDAAAERGLLVAFDLLPGLRGDARQMLRLVRDLAHPALRLCFDTGAYQTRHPGASGEVALQRVCTHLGAVRLRDAAGESGEENYPPLGQGAAVDFTRTREVLRTVAFRGPSIISFTLCRRRRPPTIEECRAGLARSLAQLRRGGWLP